MKEGIKRLLPQQWLQKFRNWRILKKNILLRAVYSDFIYVSAYPRQIEKADGTNILVLSPHMDDDIIACAGVLRKHVLAGDKIRSLYLVGRDVIRKNESQQAAHIIGITDLHFWDFNPHELKCDSTNVEKLCFLLDADKPDAIYAPHPFDNHPDHLATIRILAKSLERIRLNLDIYCYEVWTPLVPNVVVDISDYSEYKKKALEVFQSQIRQKDIVAAALGFNQYRCLFLRSRRTHAECFMKIGGSSLKKLL